MKNSKEDLIKIIQSNPDLPIVFFVNNDEIADDYSTTAMENFSVSVDTLYEYEKFGNPCYSDDYYDVKDYFYDYFSDDEAYKDYTDEQYDKMIEEYIESEVVHYKAIIVNVY